MELFKSRTRVAYTNAVGDKVYPVVVDIKKGIKSTEDIQFVSSDVNTGILSVAFISGNENFNVSGADVVCSVMRPDASTLELPCEVVRDNIVEVPLGINGTSQDGVYSFDFKVLKGGNKIIGTPIMNYSVSLSIGNDMVIEEDDRLPILTMLITQVNELKEETRETINQANVATEASREATANAIEATNNANAVSERVSQETATAISEIKQDTANAIASMNQSATDAVSNMTQKTDEAVTSMNQNTANAIADMTQKTDKAVTRVNDNLANINNVVTTKVAEIDKSKSDMTATVSNKINEVETRFNALTSSQQQSSEVIDARDGETSLKARLDRDIEKAKQVYVNVEGSHISTDSNVGYLKDVEILGNTIQDSENLADIRSVGDKVEGQELYEIPVLSCGENVFNNKWELGSISSTGEDVNSSNAKRTDFIKIGGSNIITPCMPKYVKSEGARYITIIFYDKNKKYLGVHYMGDNYIRNSFVPPVGSEYARFTMGTTITECEFEVFLDNRSFVAQGNVIKPTPYQEDKLTILSPVQLEKVGDVADRVIEKDGVWGVEKNVIDYVPKINHASDIRTYNNVESSLYRGFFVYFDDVSITRFANKPNVISNYFNPCSDKYNITSGLINGCIGGFDHTASRHYIAFSILKSELSENTNIGAFEWFKNKEDLFFKIQLATPQFIPLPHDQQIKLRIFANKTNISFLTEIEGTIKAQVPKSLGATVNTHTEQISNLNKELDRVKKLEESTVSTVTTESDFTTVEATSNGYFEDVKLEGKTLVNLSRVKDYNSSLGSRISVLSEKREFNSVFTVFVNIVEDNTVNGVRFEFTDINGNYTYKNLPPKTIGRQGFKINHSLPINRIRIYIESNDYSNNLHSSVKDIMILEGDHTQNPPSGYIEGLKSVGQSASEDGADEIVVSSCNGNYLNNDKFVEHIKNVASGVLDNQNKTITFDAQYAPNIHYKFNNLPSGSYNLILKGYNTSTNNQSSNFKLIYTDGTSEVVGSFVDGYVVKQINRNKTLSEIAGTWQTSSTVLYYDECYLIKSNNSDYIYKQDKKRLLYYNEETQAWEKPILREWDSIEKHANGKYYYHIRSVEEDYTEGDESVSDYITDMTTTVKPLAQEKVYECTNIDLITHANETNYVIESGVLSPKTTLKVHNNISNVVRILQEKVSLLESNVKASQEVQDMMILETDMRMLDIELALMEFAPMKLNLGGSDMLRSATYFNFLKNHIINETYEKEYLENVMNKYLATGRINQDEYDELYKMLYPPVYDIELPIER